LNMSEVEIKRVILALNQAGLVEIVSKVAPKPVPGAPTTAAGGRAQARAAARKPDAKLIGKLIDRLKSM
jgi:ribosomal protein L12E/L44/L45/RPP1/RPP2